MPRSGVTPDDTPAPPPEDVSGTWEDPVQDGGLPRRRVVLVAAQGKLTGELWEVLHGGGTPHLERQGPLVGTIHADGYARWSTHIPDFDPYGAELVRGRFAGDTFQGEPVDNHDRPFRDGAFELRRVSPARPPC